VCSTLLPRVTFVPVRRPARRSAGGRAQWGVTSNWAGNVVFSPRAFHRPGNLEELRGLVAGSDRVRALGTGHSFNRIADTDGDLVTLEALPRDIQVDGDQVRVTGAARYGEVAAAIHPHGRALKNMGSLPHISVAGACATGTHGSGDTNQVLAASASAVELITADGGTLQLTRGDEGFGGAVLALGSLGIVTALTLDTVPAYTVRQYLYDRLPLARLEDHLDEIFHAGYSVSLFTTWRGPVIDQVWLKRRDDDQGQDAAWTPGPTWLDARLADAARHPIPGIDGTYATQQLGEPGPWHERLPHFRMEFTPSNGDEIQSEYLVPRRHAHEAIHAVDAVRDTIAPILQVCELRTVAADDLWMSGMYENDAIAFHFTWVQDTDAVLKVLEVLEAALAPFDPRPHWGKVFLAGPDDVRRHYPRLDDFRGLLARHDPAGKFRNELVDTYVG
jgi:xylitol oxidase